MSQAIKKEYDETRLMFVYFQTVDTEKKWNELVCTIKRDRGIKWLFCAFIVIW